MLKDKIYVKIREEINFSQLMPGEHLTEVRLAKKFGCSRGPVREALTRLEREGFISLLPNHGATVNKYSPQEVEDFYSLLKLLEGNAVEWATPLLTDSEINRLAKINRSLKCLSPDQKGYIKKWNEKNMKFHQLFWQKCGNQKMYWLVEEILLRVTRYRLIVLKHYLNDYVRDHDNILDAIKKRDSLQAKKHMEKHLERAKEMLMDYFYQIPEHEKIASSRG